MANITAAMVKDLRERTGLGMMDCKKALSEAEGDIEKAIDDLRKASGMKAAKKASRVAADGIVITKVASDGNYGVILEVNSETDFVARDESFLSFANGAVEAAFASFWPRRSARETRAENWREHQHPPRCASSVCRCERGNC